jgi:hypothetical protein
MLQRRTYVFTLARLENLNMLNNSAEEKFKLRRLSTQLKMIRNKFSAKLSAIAIVCADCRC